MSKALLESLRAPFPYASLAWSVGACSDDRKHGTAFPRLDPRDIQDRLDEAVGADKWRTMYAPGPAEGGVFCTIEILIDGHWVAKTDIGYRAPTATHSMSNAGRALEVALKTTASDAFNRAAAMWGIGRYLYRFEPPYVALSHDGRRLAAFPPVPDEFLPEQERGHKPWEAQQAALEQGDHWAARKGVARPKGRQASEAKGSRALRAVSDKPPFGSPEQWRALSVEERRELAVLHNRLANRSDLQAVENFIQSPRGEALAAWAREALLQMLQEATEPAQAAAETAEGSLVESSGEPSARAEEALKTTSEETEEETSGSQEDETDTPAQLGEGAVTSTEETASTESLPPTETSSAA